MTDKKPLVSIITPYKNSVLFLPGLVASLQAQTYYNWECLLINHASRDASLALAVNLVKSDSRFRCLECHDEYACSFKSSPSVPRNFALDHATGDLICFLDVDDRWHPFKLELQVEYHLHYQLDFSVTAYVRAYTGKHSKVIVYNPPRSLSIDQLLRKNSIPMLTVMINAHLLCSKSLSLQHRFSEIPHEDYELWLRLWRQEPELRYGCLSDVLAVHSRHETNRTSNRLLMIKWLYDVYSSTGNPPTAFYRTIVNIVWQLVRMVKLGFSTNKYSCNIIQLS